MASATTTLPTPALQLPVQATDTNFQGLPIPRGDVTTSLGYFSPPADGSKSYNYVEKQPEGVAQHNYGEAAHDVRVHDVRGREARFNLDANAFQTVAGVASAEHDFTDDARIRDVYYPEVEQLVLATVPGARRIVIFDHTIRRAQPNAHRAPVTRVHIDQTPASAADRVRRHVPDDADALLQGRCRIINVWRPLNGPVMGHPLAMADGASVSDADLVASDLRYPDRTGETCMVKHNPDQKWYYLSGMRNDERLLLKCSDSDKTVGSWGRVPHTAFVHPNTPEGAVGRESIEVRTLVFG